MKLNFSYPYSVYQLTDSDPIPLGEMVFPVPLVPGVRVDLSHRPDFENQPQWWVIDRITAYPIEDSTTAILQERPPIIFIRPAI